MAAEQDKQEKTVRVMVYMPDSQRRRLKAKLALLGLSVSEWVRSQIDILTK